MKIESTGHQESTNPPLLIASVIKRGFRKGDKVEIVGNIPFALKEKPRPLLGRVTRVDGWYVYVKPLWQRWEGEWYRNELRHVL
jgi:hypothetical protein